MSTSVTRIVCHSFPQIKLFSHNIEKSFFLEGRCEEKGFQNLSTLRVKPHDLTPHSFEVGKLMFSRPELLVTSLWGNPQEIMMW